MWFWARPHSAAPETAGNRLGSAGLIRFPLSFIPFHSVSFGLAPSPSSGLRRGSSPMGFQLRTRSAGPGIAGDRPRSPGFIRFQLRFIRFPSVSFGLAPSPPSRILSSSPSYGISLAFFPPINQKPARCSRRTPALQRTNQVPADLLRRCFKARPAFATPDPAGGLRVRSSYVRARGPRGGGPLSGARRPRAGRYRLSRRPCPG